MREAQRADGKINLSGVWRGLYSSQTIDFPISFVATLLERGRTLSGVTEETRSNVSSNSKSARNKAQIDGMRHSRLVDFIKTYDDQALGLFRVNFAGLVSRDASEIAGQWSRQDGTGGTFLMVRQSHLVEADEQASDIEA
jgi:hypothetical protein